MLQENTQFYRELIEDLPDGVILHRCRRVLFANRAAARLLGAQSPARIEGMDLLDLIHPDIRDKVVANMQDTAVDSQAGFLEQKLLRFDGATAWVDVRVTAKIIDGERSAIVVMRDATQRRQASEELGKARERLQDAISNLADGFALWDAEDRLVICNEVFRGQYGDLPIMVAPGVKFEDLVRAGFLHTVKIDPVQLDQTVAERVAFHRNPQARFETKLPNGRVYLTAERHTGHGGIVTIRSDITEFRRTEQALRESEAQHRLLFDSAPYGIVVLQKGQVALANEAAAQIFGFAGVAAFVGKNLIDLTHPDDRPAVQARKNTLLAGEDVGTAAHRRVRVVRSDGAIRYVDSRASRFQYRGAPALIIHLHDVTEQVQAEEANRRLEDQLRQVEKMKSLGTLAEGVAHEFNNLLVPIIGLTELAIDSLPPEDSNAAMLKQVVTAGLRSRELIKRIHAFSRAERGGSTNESVLAQDAIGASIELVRPTIPASIHLNYQSDPSCRPVAIEHDQLEQILVNLCSNARDAIGDHTGEITVRVYPTCVTEVRAAGRQALMPGDYVVLSVRDTGCGMDATTMERIFDPFFTTKEVGQGTGLGLAVIHGIVTARGGGTTVESEPGKGAEFCVYLPIAGTHAETATTPALHTEVSS